MPQAHSYVGPEHVKAAAALSDWLDSMPEALTEGATFTVGLDGILRLAPRRSEHIACAERVVFPRAWNLGAVP